MQNLTPLAMIVVFPIFWSIISLLLAQIGGWAALAKQYPLHSDAFVGPTKTHWFSPGNVGSVRYNSTLILSASQRGLRMSVFPLFRIGHPPIFIPWDQLHNPVEQKSLFVNWLSVNVGKPTTASLLLPIWVRDYLPQDIENYRGHPAQVE